MGNVESLSNGTGLQSDAEQGSDTQTETRTLSIEETRPPPQQRPSNYEEARELLLQFTPWDDFIQFSPIESTKRTTPLRQKERLSVYPLDSLEQMARNHAFNQNPPHSAVSNIASKALYGGTVSSQSHESMRSRSFSSFNFEDFQATLSKNKECTQLPEETIDFLDRFVQYLSSTQIPHLFPLAQSLCESKNPMVRASSFMLLKLACQKLPLSAVQYRKVWHVIWRTELDDSVEPRCQQLALFTQILDSSHEEIGSNDCVDATVQWVRKGIKKGLLDSHRTAMSFHTLGKTMIISEAVQISESQVTAIISLYCALIVRFLERQGSITESHKGEEHGYNNGDLVKTDQPGPYYKGLPRDCKNTPCGSTEWQQPDIGNESDSTTTIEFATRMLRELIELIMPLDLLSPTELAEPFTIFCRVLGRQAHVTVSPSNMPHDEAEHWTRAAIVSLDFIQHLLDHTIYDLASLGLIEDLLSNITSKTLEETVGGLDAYAEYLCRKIDDHLSQLFMKEITGAQNDTDSLAFGQLLHFLEEIPDNWSKSDVLEPLFNSLTRLVRRVVSYRNWTDSFRLSRFVCVMISHLATIFDGIMSEFHPKFFFKLLAQKAHGTCESFTENFESLVQCLTVNPEMPVELVPSLLSLADYFDDQDLLSVLDRGWTLFSPVNSTWTNYLRFLARIFCEKAPAYPESRRSIVVHIERTHESIVDVDIFHKEVSDDIVGMLEATLCAEIDETILQAAFRILDQEVAMLAASEDQGRYDTAISVCMHWARVARVCCGCHGADFTPVGNSSASSSKADGCFRQLLAVEFLIKAFHNLVFPTSQFLPELLNSGRAGESSSAGKFAVDLFHMLLQMANSKESNEKITCRKARLAVFQWLLRLRADSDCHLYVISGDLFELTPLATLAHRNKGTDNPMVGVQCDVPTRLSRRKHKHGKPQDRLIAKEKKVGKKPIAQNEKPSRAMLWKLPDIVKVNIPVECGRSPSMVTRDSSNYARDKYILLPVPAYLTFICDLIAGETDWELVSYLLCHLPIQLFNSHFYCAPGVKPHLQRLAKVVCDSIVKDRLYKNMVHIQPRTVGSGHIKALLVQTLAVFVGHHAWLEEQEFGPDSGSTSLRTVIECLIHGLSEGEITRGHCLQALTFATFELPEVLIRYTPRIIDKLSSLATNPNFSVLIVEYLFIIGNSRELCFRNFRDVDYKRVFGLGLMHIHDYAKKVSTKTSHGNESYSLAQHIYGLSFSMIYVWFLTIPLEHRVPFAQFILTELSNTSDSSPSHLRLIEVAVDWLTHYTYANVDNIPHPSFLYKSIIAPTVDMNGIAPKWTEKKRMEEANVANRMAFKAGNSIIMVSTLKKPADWTRIVVTRGSGETELLCHVEGLKHPDSSSESWEFNEGNHLYSQPEEERVAWPVLNYEINDPATPHQALITPSLVPVAFGGISQSRVQAYQNMKELDKSLEILHHTPPFTVHRVGVVYVSLGQTQEMEILSNQHGSLTYSHVVARLGRVMSGVQWAHDLTGSRPETHGKYIMSWWNDVLDIYFHVATMMPNIHECLFKKQQIGNDAVKIIWNDGGRSFDMDTLPSEFNLINIIVEPHSRAASGAAFSTSLSKYFKVSMQTPSKLRLPPVTPLQGYKLVTLEALPSVLRQCAQLACHFCDAWINTGADGAIRYPLMRNREARMRCIEGTKKHLHNKVKPQTQNVS